MDTIHLIADMLGLGRLTGIEMLGEKKGIIPNKEWKRYIYNQPWYQGDTINTSIGQGFVEITPIQLLVMFSRAVTGKKINASLLNKEPEIISLGIKNEHINKLKNALVKVFLDPKGTGYRSLGGHISLAGKSGTSQIVGTQHKDKSLQHKDHSIFVGYAPYNSPKYAIATVIENGGWGSESALPISVNILSKLFQL